MKIENEELSVVTHASILCKPEHPLHATFARWCKKYGNKLTKRQARKFLQKYPQYRVDK